MHIIFVFILTATIIYAIQKWYRRYCLSCKIPGPWAVPLVGNVQIIRKINPQFLFLTFDELRTQYRKTYRLWLGTQLWVFLHSATETRDALNASTLVRADTFNQLSLLIGNGLLISQGKQWEIHRRILGPAFHPNVLSTFVATIHRFAEKLVEKFRCASATTGMAIEASEYLFPCIMDIIMANCMDKELNTQDDVNSIYTKAFHKINELLYKRMVNPLLGMDFIFKRTAMWKELDENLNLVHTLMENIINDRSNYLKTVADDSADYNAVHGKRQNNLLDTLLLAKIAGKSLTLKDIRDELNTFILAGVDTTSAAMGFILYALGKFPKEQSKVHTEIEEMYNDTTTRTSVTFNDINNLEYLDIFVKECLRYYTIVPLTGRQTTTDTKIGEHVYCADVTIWINMYALAHDEEYFTKPYDFCPERFRKDHETTQSRQHNLDKAFSYLPFSSGPHVCIGRKYALMIMKILIVNILHNFEIYLRDPVVQLQLSCQMVLKSLNGLNIILKERA